jgi:hypothetical protein
VKLDTAKTVDGKTVSRWLDKFFLETTTTTLAAIKAKTDNLPSDPADQSLLEAAITAAGGAGGDIDGFTRDEAQKIGLAALAGKLSGAATTTNTIRAADDSKARITATVDSDGNRTAITLDATG